jgi:hypothetical protein
MKAGDIVRVPGYNRDWVALPLTLRNIRLGANARTPGMYLWGGAWYGRDLMNNRTFGKILRSNVPHKIVGHVKIVRTLRNDLKDARRAKLPSRTLARMRNRAELRSMRLAKTR